MADVLLFGGDAPRVLLNIGGMANLTFVRRRAMEEGAFAFDTGPGMVVIDSLARRVDPSVSFDRDGAISAAGTVHEDVLADLLADPYFDRRPPKSTGRERFGGTFADALAARVPGPDGVATAVELTARSIARAIREWVPGARTGQGAGIEVVVSGGGSRHPGVMRSLESHLGHVVRRFEDLFFSADAKEAVAFALLGYLTVHGQPGNLPRATGAVGSRVLGSITPP
jgi:anhydro-N-acetylmuramic acid kinase